MFKTLFDFILNRKGHPAQNDSVAPYKVETPAAEAPTTKVEIPGAVNAIAEPAKCGCGRSPSGYCVGLHKLTSEEWNKHPANPAPVVEAKTETKAAAKKPAAKKAAAKKPAAMKAPAKPRAKKAKE